MSDSKDSFKKILYNQGTLLLAIIGTTVGTIAWIQNPQVQQSQDIALIQQSMQYQQESSKLIQESIKKIETNHLTHLQNYALEMKDLKAEQVEQGKIIVEILTKLNDHMKDK